MHIESGAYLPANKLSIIHDQSDGRHAGTINVANVAIMYQNFDVAGVTDWDLVGSTDE